MPTPWELVDQGATMEDMWKGFAMISIPILKAGDIQYDEMKKAFYSGALCLFNWIMVQMDPQAEVTAGDINKVTVIDAEIRAFFDSLPQQPEFDRTH